MEETLKKKCELFIEYLLQNWHSFCSIDTEHLRFERFEEMDIVRNEEKFYDAEGDKPSFNFGENEDFVEELDD